MSRPDPWTLALVTGAASGIGRCFCLELAATGCSIVAVDRSPLEQVAAEFMAAGAPAVHTLRIDLTAADAAERVMKFLEGASLVPDLVVNNAGIFDFATVESLTPERLNLYIDLHMRAVTHLSRSAAALMISHGVKGNILNMSSMSCWMPMPGIAMYSATKAYIRVFSRALAVELSGTGVEVTVACPGGIATDLFGLPPRLQKLGVSVKALATPQGFVRGALRAARRGKHQYINGLINRITIVAVGSLPKWARRLVKTQLLTRYGRT